MIRTSTAAKFILVGKNRDLAYERQVATEKGYT
jgi:hypothetical protein